MTCPKCGELMQAFPIPHTPPAEAGPHARGAGVESVIYHCGGTTGCGHQEERS